MNIQTIQKHVLYIGLNDKDLKKQIVSTSIAKKLISKIVGDCTISDAIGTYTHDDGTVVNENSLRVEILFKQDEEVIKDAKILKELLNQESIGFEKALVNSTLI